MGIGFAFLLHLVVIFILSIGISIIASIITFFFSNKEKRKRKILIAIISPFIGLYTLYFVRLFGLIVVSEIKNVDVGFGDTWYVPLADSCELQIIDLPEHAYINNNGLTVISDVSQIQQLDYRIFGKTYNDEYFSYNIKTDQLEKFVDAKELETQNPSLKIELVRTMVFYTDKKNDIAGFSLIIVEMISLAISVVVLYLIRKLILGKQKSNT